MKNDLIKMVSRGINFNLVLSEYINIAEKFICHFCKNLVKDPHCCGKCQECFCMECFTQFKKSKKNAKCPIFDNETNKICNNKLDEGYDITNREKILLNEIKLNCVNYNAGCDEILNYEYFYKHVRSCKLRTFRCTNKNCNFQCTKEKVNEHKLNCEFEMIICEFCKDEILRNKIDNHNQICEELEKFCFFCKKNFKVKNLYNHNQLCRKEYLNFSNEENLKKIKNYEELVVKIQQIEHKLKELKSYRSFSMLLGKKKKILENKGNKVLGNYEIKKEEELEKNESIMQDTFLPNDITWVNSKKQYRHNRNGKFTFSSLKNMNFDFTISIRINNLNEKDINFSIGFAGKPIVKENYFIGHSKSYLEWALHRFGVITEKNTLNNNFINEIKIENNDTIELRRKQSIITFAINGKYYDYSFNFTDENMYLNISLAFINEEVEIIKFNT